VGESTHLPAGRSWVVSAMTGPAPDRSVGAARHPTPRSRTHAEHAR
jgi:hypothetical protein